MDDVILSSTLRQQGYVRSEIARFEREGRLTHLRRGAWAHVPSPAEVSRHRQLITATVPLVSPDAVLSHASAAILHGLPVPDHQLQAVHWTRSRRGGGRARRQIHVYAARLESHEITVIDDVQVTTIERTVVDISRHSPLRTGVATADAALRLGLDRSLLLEAADSARHRPGGAQARRVAEFADPGSESPGESWSRVELAAIGWAPSHLQYEIFDRLGRFVGRSDFCWEEQRILGEFDGKIKYGRELNGSNRIEDVLFAEKRREDALRDLQWQVVRWVSAELSTPRVIGERLERAARRAAGVRRTL